MLLVVFYHSCLYMGKGWFPIESITKSKVLLHIADWLSSFHIYSFVLISGFIFCYVKNVKKSYLSFGNMLQKKIRRLLIPAIIFSCIWAAPFGAFFFNYDIYELFKRYILGLAPNQIWFLWMLFWVFIISWPFVRFFHKPIGYIIIFALYILGNFGGKIIPNYFQIWTGCEYVLFFWIGYIFYINLDRIRFDWKSSALCVILALFLYLEYYYIVRYLEISRIIILAIKMFVNISGAIACFVLLQSITNYFKLENSIIIKVFNGKTMVIFLFHQQLIYVLIYIMNGNNINPWIQTFLHFFMSTLFGYLMSVIMLKTNITRIMIGEKTIK